MVSGVLSSFRDFSSYSAKEAGGVPLRQRTLKSSISCAGVGLHSGVRGRITLLPAGENTGIVLRRTDVGGGGACVPVRLENVKSSCLCTVVGDQRGNSIATIEHLMSALVAMQVDNVEVHVNGPEIPAMDGSASPFVFLLECAGLVEQDAPRSFIQILKPISITSGDARAVLMPGSGLIVDFGIDFPAEAIGQQSCRFHVTEETFKADISRARTFCMIEDLPKMRDLGLALGGSLDNALVVNGAAVLNEGGLRYNDEFARHKALDAIGDLALLGAPVCGHYKGWKSSHMLNASLIQALLADTSAWRRTTLFEADLSASVPVLESAV